MLYALELFQGTYATVFKGKSQLKDNLVALKEIRLEHESWPYSLCHGIVSGYICNRVQREESANRQSCSP